MDTMYHINLPEGAGEQESLNNAPRVPPKVKTFVVHENEEIPEIEEIEQNEKNKGYQAVNNNDNEYNDDDGDSGVPVPPPPPPPINGVAQVGPRGLPKPTDGYITPTAGNTIE